MMPALFLVSSGCDAGRGLKRFGRKTRTPRILVSSGCDAGRGLKPVVTRKPFFDSFQVSSGCDAGRGLKLYRVGEG